jgi:hypothetical protein
MFEQWVLWVFDHPVTKSEWHRTDSTPHPEPAKALAFMTELFETSESLLQDYSDAQINQGLWFLFSNAYSQHFYAFTDRSLPEEQRLRGVHSIGTLFTGVFAKRCSPHLSHLNEPGASGLNSACYMLWDVTPLPRYHDEVAYDAVNSAALGVMEGCLSIDHDACRESALHGLSENHWFAAWRPRIHAVIDAFLEQNKDLRLELADYARRARSGSVQ